MNLSRRINTSLLALLIMIVVASAAGGYGTFSLSNLLSFITTQAWDTADGAMEGSIGIEAQIIAVERITAGRGEGATELMAEGEATAKEALSRMISAGLMSDSEVSDINNQQANFNKAKEAVVRHYGEFAQHGEKLAGLFASMQDVMVFAEELGDSQVEVLEQNPGRYISWDSGLDERWSAADGTMEAHIHFLEVNYYLQQYVASGQGKAIRSKLNNAQAALTETITEVTSLPVFKESTIDLPGQPKAVLADVLLSRMEALNKEVIIMAKLADAYHQALDEYTQASDLLLATIEAVEESADGKVESQTSVIDQTKAIAYGLLGCVLLLGVGIAYASMRKVRTDVVTPIENLTRNMQEAANGKTINNTYIDRDDEIGSMANALKVFVDLFEDNKRISADSHRTARALAVCNTAVLIADANNAIIFANDAMIMLMDKLSPTLKEQGIDINGTSLLNHSVDVFEQGNGFMEKVQVLSHAQREEISIGSLKLMMGIAPINSDGDRVGTVLEIEDITEAYHQREKERQVAQENASIKQALDNVSANVMVADADRNIIYLNGSLSNMLKKAEKDFQTELPHFNANSIVGKSLDQFHKNPNHQLNMLNRLTTTHQSTFEVGGRSINLTLNPIMDDNHQRLGTVVEWLDRTVEVSIEQEVDSIVDAAAAGDLSKRITLEGKDGFFYTLSKGLNSLLDSASQFVTDVGHMFVAMNSGDLTHQIHTEYKGDFEEIKRNANASVENLTDVMTKIRTLSKTVETAAHEIAQGNSDLSQRTEDQASSLQETASSMENILQTVKASADNANSANDLAAGAHQQAQAGESVVKDAINAMDEILTSSKKINDIIGVIDEIAFQTNLLALNAAVEAARAGEQGRGFAVVASEVRSLSQRSSNAAKEIKDLIQDSVAKVESGSVLVNESGKTLSEIMAAVEQVALMIKDVSATARSQTNGIEEVNTAISRMDNITQQNAALVEQASASSGEMSDQARQLDQLVGFFKLNTMPVTTQTKTTVAPHKTPPAAPKPNTALLTEKRKEEPVSFKPKQAVEAKVEVKKVETKKEEAPKKVVTEKPKTPTKAPTPPPPVHDDDGEWEEF